jgi:hypothetical protein
VKYQLFTLYQNNQISPAKYLTLSSRAGSYTILVHPEEFIALEDFILCIPKIHGSYFYSDKKYLLIVSEHATQLGLALDSDV